MVPQYFAGGNGPPNNFCLRIFDTSDYSRPNNTGECLRIYIYITCAPKIMSGVRRVLACLKLTGKQRTSALERYQRTT